MFGRDEKVSQGRLTAVQYIVLAVFLLLTYGLWRLQVSQSDLYATLAEKNRIRNVPILAPRGKIYDREGRIIVDNYPSFSALLLRDSTRDLTLDADLIAQGLHLDPKEVRDRIRKFNLVLGGFDFFRGTRDLEGTNAARRAFQLVRGFPTHALALGIPDDA